MTFKMSKKLEQEILSIARGEPLPYLKRMKGMRFRTASEIKPEIEREQARLQAYLKRYHRNRIKRDEPKSRLRKDQRKAFMRMKMKGMSYINMGKRLDVQWSALKLEERKIYLYCAKLHKQKVPIREIGSTVGVTRKQVESILSRQGFLNKGESK